MNTGKLTKIVATISHKKADIPFLKELMNAGMNVVRINTAHQVPDESMIIVNNVRAITDRVPLMIDTKGPEIRTTQTSQTIDIVDGMMIPFTGKINEISSPACIHTSYPNFAKDLSVGDRILIDDGAIEFEVMQKDPASESLMCKALNNGSFAGKKSINLPGVRTNLPSINEKDKVYIDWAIKNDIEFIAHSFVRNKQDILDLKALLGDHASKIRIIAKIENQDGVNNIDEILDHAYGVMIARGDLGIEVPEEKLPVIQNALLNKCINRRKPVIIATQMMHSMIENPRPTRAEVTDVAHAVYQGTDAIMLSGETAYGKYPVEAVAMMTKIALEVEAERPTMRDSESVILTTAASALLTKQAVIAAAQLDAKAIIADTHSGRTVMNIAGFRGKKPVYALCYSKEVMKSLALSYGVYPIYYTFSQADGRNYIHSQFLSDATQVLIHEEYILEDDLIIIMGGNFDMNKGSSFMEITKAKQMLKH